MALHNIIGKAGEDTATQYLRKKGYKIIERNWRLGNLETDIIASKDNTIVFVEVKTRSANSYYAPEDAVDYTRKRRLSIGAQAYIRYNKIDLPCRFDIIAITLQPDGTQQINHIEDAFAPPAKYTH